MPTLEERVTRLEERVNKMDADLKQHFIEFRAFVVETMGGFERRLTVKLAEVDSRLSSRLDGVDSRLSSRLDEVDSKLNDLSSRFTIADSKLDTLLSRVPRRPRATRRRGRTARRK